MSKNLKALTKDELEFLNSKYKFKLMDNYVVVSCVGFDRKVLHEIDKPFTLTTPIRRITITPKAIKCWIEQFKDKYSLLEVQNSINTLIITYQDISIDDIKIILERNNSLIKIV